MGRFVMDKPADEAKKVAFVLQKRGVPKVRATVALDIDISGSMQGLFRAGAVQSAIERTLPVAMQFDDDGSVDTFVYSNGSRMAEIESATLENYQGFVDREILRHPTVSRLLWGGTAFAPVIGANLKKYGLLKEKSGMFGGSKTPEITDRTISGDPAIVYFFSDGDNEDEDATYSLLKQTQDAKAPIYFVLVGIGTGTSFRFLRKVADDLDNTGFVAITDLDRAVNDDAIYENLLPEELCSWLKVA